MIRSLWFSSSGEIIEIETEQIEDIIARNNGYIWVDVDVESVESIKPLLQEVFKFHPLAIDDALQETHVPKVDSWGQYLYLVLRSVKVEENDNFEISTPELDIFLGPNYLVTYRETPLSSIEKVWATCQQDQRYTERSAGYLLYQISDAITINLMVMIDELDDRIDQIEDEIFDKPTTETLEHIFTVKRAVLRLRRTVLPQREVFNKLASGDLALISESDQAYYRDIYDHMVRMQEINESLRDLITGALDTYLSVVNNRMNDVMKTLTIITTLFMPLSFLTGNIRDNFSLCGQGFSILIPSRAPSKFLRLKGRLIRECKRRRRIICCFMPRR